MLIVCVLPPDASGALCLMCMHILFCHTRRDLVNSVVSGFTQADALDEQRTSAAAGSKAAGAGPLPDISAFLRPVGVMEARYVRVLSSLCALTYYLDDLTVGAAGCRMGCAAAITNAAVYRRRWRKMGCRWPTLHESVFGFVL